MNSLRYSEATLRKPSEHRDSRRSQPNNPAIPPTFDSRRGSDEYPSPAPLTAGSPVHSPCTHGALNEYQPVRVEITR